MPKGNLFAPAKPQPPSLQAILNRRARQGLVPPGQSGRLHVVALEIQSVP